MHVLIEKPNIKPDPDITHKLRLDKHQSDGSLKKASSRSRAMLYQGEDRQSTKNSVHYRVNDESERSSPQRTEND